MCGQVGAKALGEGETPGMRSRGREGKGGRRLRCQTAQTKQLQQRRRRRHAQRTAAAARDSQRRMGMSSAAPVSHDSLCQLLRGAGHDCALHVGQPVGVGAHDGVKGCRLEREEAGEHAMPGVGCNFVRG